MPKILVPIQRWLTNGWHLYEQLYVSHRGMYSLERLHLFQQYQATNAKSNVRVLLVCLLTPVPALAFIIGLEAIPLKPPSAGWKANDTTWLRLWLFGVVITYCLLAQAREMVVGLPLSARQALVVSVVTATGYVAAFVLTVALWKFPMPFGTVIGVVPFVCCLFATLLVVLGPAKLREIQGLKKKPLAIYGRMVIAQCSLAFVYPTYNAIFVVLNATQQTLFLLLLPVIKMAMKNVVAWITVDTEDLIPELALFTVELFHALYLVTCMQNAGSAVTTVAIVALDAVNCVRSLRSVYKQTSLVHDLQKRHTSPRIQPRHLLDLVRQICHEQSLTQQQMAPHVRLRTAARYRLGMVDTDLLRAFKPVVDDQPSTSTHESVLAVQGRQLTKFLLRAATIVHPITVYPMPTKKLAQIIPTVVVPVGWPPPTGTTTGYHRSTTSLAVDLMTTDEKQQLVQQTLKMLFHCEYLVLTEYIECAMPLVYAVYLAVLFHLHNAQFYVHTRQMTRETLDNTLLVILIYASLELVSLVVLHMILKHKFGLSAFHQLAFVLETQMGMIQSKMLVWAPFILQFTLIHCGVDFTFKFDSQLPTTDHAPTTDAGR